ncbi:MAG: 4'-phosphopantetheinyl transferase superfamily protein [Saprospiraceae bacterium]
MPQVFHKKEPSREIIVWKIDEPISFFQSRLPMELQALPSDDEARNAEYLASRYLLTLLVPEIIVASDSNKKLQMVNDHRYISISHTKGLAASMVSHEACGIDIEMDLPRITKIASKFNLPHDLEMLQGTDYQQNLYTVWCAKEAMYKAYGLGGIDFKNHLRVELEAMKLNKSTFTGLLKNAVADIRFTLHYEYIQQSIHLVYGEIISA